MSLWLSVCVCINNIFIFMYILLAQNLFVESFTFVLAETKKSRNSVSAWNFVFDRALISNTLLEKSQSLYNMHTKKLKNILMHFKEREAMSHKRLLTFLSCANFYFLKLAFHGIMLTEFEDINQTYKCLNKNK